MRLCNCHISSSLSCISRIYALYAPPPFLISVWDVSPVGSVGASKRFTLRGLHRRPAPQQAILSVRAEDLNSAKSASGYSLAVLADYSVPLYFPLYPYYNPNRVFWPVSEDFFKKHQPCPQLSSEHFAGCLVFLRIFIYNVSCWVLSMRRYGITGSRAISPFGRRPTVGACQSGGSTNTAPKGGSPARPGSGAHGRSRKTRKSRPTRAFRDSAAIPAGQAPDGYPSAF